MNNGAWTRQEDERIMSLSHYVPARAPLSHPPGLRQYCGKICKVRWLNKLRPHLQIPNFSEDEDDLIIKLHALLGNRWSLIAGRLPGRTENEVKKHWNCQVKNKLKKMGTHPTNHCLIHYNNFLRRRRPQNTTTSTVSKASSSSSSSSSSSCSSSSASSSLS